MNLHLPNIQKSKLPILYILGFIFAFTSSLPAYINSSFLTSLTSEQSVGLFYSIGSIFSLVTLLFIPKLLKKYGNYKVTLVAGILSLCNFFSLALSPNMYVVLFSFLISGSIAIIIYFDLDVFIEHDSQDIRTGGIRGTYLTCLNFAWLLSPWLAGIIVGDFLYRKVYFIVALIMIPIIFIITLFLRNFKDPDYIYINIFHTIKNIGKDKNIEHIWFSSFLLQIFYSWMIIYTPIYLHKYIGFSWGDIGLIFSIMLIPFVLIQIPLGYLADKRIGEKEMLTLGFLIIGVSTAIIPLVHTMNIVIWAFVLFMTRVGAAMVEVMNDTYFFKIVADRNVNIINVYRTTSPIAYIIGPLLATIFIYFVPLVYIFYILGLVMLFGLRYSLTIKDTK